MDDQAIEQTAELLKKFKPGFLPYPVFEQIARLVALPILEFIPLRNKDGRTEVLLIERSADDTVWPGMLHTPGTVIRATDLNKDNSVNWPALERIVHDELADTPLGPPTYVGSMIHESMRGVEQAQLYWVEVTGEPKAGVFYPTDTLPKELIESQKDFIRAAVNSFRKYKSTE